MSTATPITAIAVSHRLDWHPRQQQVSSKRSVHEVEVPKDATSRTREFEKACRLLLQGSEAQHLQVCMRRTRPIRLPSRMQSAKMKWAGGGDGIAEAGQGVGLSRLGIPKMTGVLMGPA